jgi:hypothetical protein
MLIVLRWRRPRIAVAAIVLGTLMTQPTVAAVAEPSTHAGGPRVMADYTQRSSARSRDLSGDGVPDVLTRQPGLDNGALWLYPGTGTLNGTHTLGTRVEIGRGWNIYNWIGVAEITGDTQDPETVPEMPADVLARRASDGALLVYPHSGKLNGLSTLQAPVVIGSSWNNIYEFVLADVNGDGFDDILAYDYNDDLWLYPHSRVFNGKSTFGARTLVRHGRLGWLLSTEWSNDFPDLATNYIATGDMETSVHSREVAGTGTWLAQSTQISSGQFTGDLLDMMFLNDITGDGRDDVVVRGLDGALVAFPFTGVRGLATFGTPVVIGSSGWGVMDLLT